jgi:NAD(P)-dependent dehydrogenase (short-subunit alcohol dehydrogenase family)|tara:strand:- start:218 stop:1081 length:864 start_codon:yes stop_codon:yes gene_type:complete
MDKHDRTVIITGGASGIGKSLAFQYGRNEYNVVIGDVEEPTLESTVSELRSEGILAVGIHTDVSDLESVEALASASNDLFGPPSIVCLNAGVGAGGEMGEVSISTWQWVLSVNLWGVIHGLSVFLPTLQKQDSGHIVITSSIAGHLSYPRMGPYNASKHAVLTIAETLFFELAEANSNVGVSVLCPGLVRTQILDSDRNRPETLMDATIALSNEEQEIRETIVREIYDQALDPSIVAALVYDAVEANNFYIFTDDSFSDALRERHRNIENAQNPNPGANLIEEHLND